MVTTQGLAEIVLMVGDVESSRRFYEQTLGLKVISPNLGGPVFLQVGESAGVPQQIVLIPRPAASAEPSATAPRGLSTTSVSSFRPEALRKRGESSRCRDSRSGRASIHFLPVEAIYVDDPDGNEVELVAAR